MNIDFKVFEKRVLRGTVGLKTDEMFRGWRKLRNDQLQNLNPYTSPNIIRIIKSRRIRWLCM
jgi:hypothetical protein